MAVPGEVHLCNACEGFCLRNNMYLVLVEAMFIFCLVSTKT